MIARCRLFVALGFAAIVSTACSSEVEEERVGTSYAQLGPAPQVAAAAPVPCTCWATCCDAQSVQHAEMCTPGIFTTWMPAPNTNQAYQTACASHQGAAHRSSCTVNGLPAGLLPVPYDATPNSADEQACGGQQNPPSGDDAPATPAPEIVSDFTAP